MKEFTKGINMKITVVGIGYVGLSNAILLAQHNDVYAVDVIEEKITAINNRVSPIKDEEAQKYLSSMELMLRATLDKEQAYKGVDFTLVSQKCLKLCDLCL